MAKTEQKQRYSIGTVAFVALVVWIGARAELRQPGTINDGVTSAVETGRGTFSATVNGAKGAAQDIGAGNLLAPTAPATTDSGQLGGVEGEEFGQ